MNKNLNLFKLFILLYSTNIFSGLSTNFKLDNEWSTGFEAHITLKNNTNTPAINWSLDFDLAPTLKISSLWNGNFIQTGHHVKVTVKPENNRLESNQSIDVGFVISGSSGAGEKIRAIRVNNGSGEAIRDVGHQGHITSQEIKQAAAVSAGPGIADAGINKPVKKYEAPGDFKMVGYFPNWFFYPKTNREKFEPKDIDGNLLTHIIYAFAKPYTTDATKKVINYKISLTDPWADVEHGQVWGINEKYWGHFKQLKDLKKKYPHLKTLIAIGGWTIWQEGFPAEKFSKLASDPKSRLELIMSAIEFCANYDFDGIDIDWEYPGFVENGGDAKDTKNFSLLMQEFYTAVKDSNLLKKIYASYDKVAPKELLLSFAAPAAPKHIQNIELNKIANFVDWINLMTYDFHGAWAPNSADITNHNAPLFPTKFGDKNFNIDGAVKNYLSLGVPNKKLVIGMALYGRSFAGVAYSPTGLFSKYSAAGTGTDDSEPGMILYADIVKRFGNLKRYWDNLAQVPYLFNEKTKEFISYDDTESLAKKAQYIKQNNLGGAMFWCLAKESVTWDAIKTVFDVLKT